MTPRRKIEGIGSLLVLSFLLQQSCTDNEASRVISGLENDAGEDSGGTSGTGAGARGGATVTGGTSNGGTPSSGGSGATGTGGSQAGAGGEGGVGVDPCLPECDDPAGCELTPIQQLEVDICRRFHRHCTEQPADVMTQLGLGEAVAAGPVAPSTVTRPQLGETEAEAYTIEAVLRAGGRYQVSYSGSGAGGEGGAAGEPLGERTVTYASEEWDPRGPIEDVTKIVPGMIVDPNGDPKDERVFTTIQSALSLAVEINSATLGLDCPRVFIKVMPGTYREKITVRDKTSAPPITLYGVDRDPSKIVIVRGDSAAGDEGSGTRLTIQQSATFTNSLPKPFHARNLTIANDYVGGTYPGGPELQTAVALLTQADRALFENVRIIGHRHSLYVKSTDPDEAARAYFRNCYIDGDEEIILGRGAAVIDQCRIHSLGDRVSGGSITAPSTRVDNPHGILIINSELTADARVSNVFLGRQWYEGEEEEAVGKAIIRNSILGAHIRSGDLWQTSLRATPRTPVETEQILYTSDDYYVPMTGLVPPEIYLAEFGNSGPGAAQ